MFSMLVRPFITRPLRRLFSESTTITPELAFDGKIIIVDLPVQEYRLAGRIAALAWKHCFQMAVLRRTPPHAADTYLRPVFLFADEAQYFLTGESDTLYQAVARSSGGCSVFLFQNREILLSMLGNNAVVDSLLGNLQTKFFCQNSSPETNRWAAELLGERFTSIISTSFGRSGEPAFGFRAGGDRSASIQQSEQRRYFVEPARFTTLKRGGEGAAYEVETIVYNGGKLFAGERGEDVPYMLMTIPQR
jgi:type IV secretory pathway TraG/TraD family ATPase VirD4